MSEERFDRIELTLQQLVNGQEAMRTDFTQRFDEVDQRFKAVDHRFKTIDQRLDTIDQRIDEQGRHMRLLHNEALERIAAIGEFDGPSRAEFQQGLADLEERIGRRLDPLTLAVRHHSEAIRQNTADIEELKRSQARR